DCWVVLEAGIVWMYLRQVLMNGHRRPIARQCAGGIASLLQQGAYPYAPARNRTLRERVAGVGLGNLLEDGQCRLLAHECSGEIALCLAHRTDLAMNNAYL